MYAHPMVADATQLQDFEQKKLK